MLIRNYEFVDVEQEEHLILNLILNLWRSDAPKHGGQHGGNSEARVAMVPMDADWCRAVDNRGNRRRPAVSRYQAVSVEANFALDR